MYSLPPKEEYVIEIAQTILLNKGTINLPYIEYRKDEWWISSELDIETIKRSKLLGFPRISIISMAISHNEYLVFNYMTRTLVHNALIPTVNMFGVSPTLDISWITSLESLSKSIEQESIVNRLSLLNNRLSEINDKLNTINEDNKIIHNLLNK